MIGPGRPQLVLGQKVGGAVPAGGIVDRSDDHGENRPLFRKPSSQVETVSRASGSRIVELEVRNESGLRL
jgi:hypothetical protein